MKKMISIIGITLISSLSYASVQNKMNMRLIGEQSLKSINLSSKDIDYNGRWFLKGFNTDVYGFRQSIRSLLKNHHQKALIFGTGGASKAVAYVLNQYGITVNFISRSQLGSNVFSWDKMNDNMIEL